MKLTGITILLLSMKPITLKFNRSLIKLKNLLEAIGMYVIIVNKSQATVIRYENLIKKIFKIYVKIETVGTEQNYSIFSDVLDYTKNEIINDYVFEFKFKTKRSNSAQIEIFHFYYNKNDYTASIYGLTSTNIYRNEQK